MRFSIIVPVYNVQAYLAACLDSLLDQAFSDYEILLINDGSTDRSGEICRRYQEKASCIRYFEKPNGGLSDARNYGMARAAGEYLLFVDSDDWIRSGTLARLDRCIGDRAPDAVITRLTEVYPDREVNRDRELERLAADGFSKKQAFLWNFVRAESTWPAPKTIVRTAFLQTAGLQFLRGRLHEDMDWTSRLYLAAKSFMIFPEEWYYHRMGRSGSITTNLKGKNYVDTIEIAAALSDELRPRGDLYAKLVLKQVMGSVYAKINQIGCCPEEEWELVSDAIERNRSIFAVAPKCSHRLFVLAMQVIGVKNALRLLAKIHS